jgi:hypothetical protein
MASEPAAPSRSRSRTSRRRIAVAIWAGVGTFVVLLVLDGAWAGTRLVRGLTLARSELSVAIESVVTGDPEAARPHFVAAAEAADLAMGSAGHPSFGIAGLLPLLGDNIDAAAAVAEASRATALAGRTMVEVARDLRWSDIGIPASTGAGSLDTAAYEAAAPGMESVAAQLGRALARLEAAGGDGLVGPVASGYRDAVDGLTRRADLAARFRDALELVPTMFGGERPRRYLVCVSTLGVPRPGGGAPASVGLLIARGGSIELRPLSPAPTTFGDVQTSPDWPTTARALTVAANEAGYPRLDGLILLDAAALEDLVWMTGDVPVEGRTLALSDQTAATALEILMQVLARRPAVESLALAAAADARDRHLAVYLTRRDEQRLVHALGLDGKVRLGGEGVLPVVATWTTEGTAHVGALVETSIRHDVVIHNDGSASVETELLFQNGAGTDPPSVLLGGRIANVPIGTFAADITLYLPRNARDVVAETSRPSPIVTGRDLGLATVTGSIDVRAGASSTLTVTYVVEDAARRMDGTKGIVVRLVPQPTLGGVRYQVRIELPDDSTIVSASPELERRGGTAVFSGVRAGSVDLDVRYA